MPSSISAWATPAPWPGSSSLLLPHLSGSFSKPAAGYTMKTRTTASEPPKPPRPNPHLRRTAIRQPCVHCAIPLDGQFLPQEHTADLPDTSNPATRPRLMEQLSPRSRIHPVRQLSPEHPHRLLRIRRR